jgi:signal transduction histidine kinase/streptogramin lyase
LYEDRQGGLWLAFNMKGLFYFDGDSFQKVKCSSQNILSVDEDRDANIWLGTVDGVNLLTPAVVKFLRCNVGDYAQNAFSVAVDTNGLCWVVWASGLISRSLSSDLWNSPDAGEWSVVDAKPVLQPQCVVADPAGGVWFGTDTSGIYRWKDGAVAAHLGTENGLAANSINVLHVSPDGSLWIGSEANEPERFFLQSLKGGVFHSYPLPPGTMAVVAFASDAEGNCWFATYDGRLFCVTRSGGVEEKTALLSPTPYTILSLFITSDKSLWVGFAGQGLGRLKDGRFSRYRMEQGLHENFISRIISDQSGRIWLAGNRGIARLSPEDFDELDAGRSKRVQPVVYGKQQGLLSLKATEFFGSGVIRDNAGRLLFGMKGGLALIRPEEAGDRQAPPTVVILSMNVDGRKIAEYGGDVAFLGPADLRPLELRGQGNQRLRIPPGARHLEIVFAALGFKLSESTVFRCRLKGFARDWNEVGTQRSVSYYGIKPGDYQFQVVARNSDGIWNETGASLAFTLEQYWWEAGWFRVGGPLVAVCGLMCGLLFFARRRQKLQVERLQLLRATDKDRARIAADLHDEMGSSLAQIAILSNLIKKEGNMDALQSDQLSQINLRARNNVRKLGEIVWAVNPARDSLEHLASYLCKFAEEYLALEGVRFRADIPDELPDIYLDSATRHHVFLATKEAIHNAIRHGRPSKLTLGISIIRAREGEKFTVSVCDDGCGFDGDTALACGRGVSNMQSRLAQMGGELRISRAQGGGSTILFYVPLKKRRG